MSEFTPRIEWAKEWLSTPKTSYFGGQWQECHGDAVESVNPATGQVIGSIISATKEDVERAVDAARDAFDNGPWTHEISDHDRAEIMRKLAALTREHTEELATLEVMDNGKTFGEACWDVGDVADFLDYYAGWADKYYGQINPVTGNFLSYTVREPMGVCGQIIPWNYPMDMAGYKIAPALAMKNVIIMKPSSNTPFSLTRLFEIYDESGLLPPGVMNLIHGPGKVGSYITSNPRVDKAAFTGSTKVGRQLLHDSADSNLKALSLELGGKSPNIIFADAADLDAAIDRSYVAMFSGKGEKCSEPTRLLVERPVYEKVLEGLKEKYKTWKVGDPFDPTTDQGAQCGKQHFESITNYIEIGKQEGAKILVGGDRNVEGSNANGYFINPTIFYDCNNSMRIAREEIFGPVLCVIPFDTEEEAIAIANDSEYGLGSGFWTNDVARSQRVANALQAGMVFVNRYGCYEYSGPFGGYKTSGFGGMECGNLALDLYTKRKTIWIAY